MDIYIGDNPGDLYYFDGKYFYNSVTFEKYDHVDSDVHKILDATALWGLKSRPVYITTSDGWAILDSENNSFRIIASSSENVVNQGIIGVLVFMYPYNLNLPPFNENILEHLSHCYNNGLSLNELYSNEYLYTNIETPVQPKIVQSTKRDKNKTFVHILYEQELKDIVVHVFGYDIQVIPFKSLLQDIVDSERFYNRDFNELIINFLINRDKDLQNGDIVGFEPLLGYYNYGKYLYKDYSLIKLNYHISSLGVVPTLFQVITEYPIKYWSDYLYGNIVPFKFRVLKYKIEFDEFYFVKFEYNDIEYRIISNIDNVDLFKSKLNNDKYYKIIDDRTLKML